MLGKKPYMLLVALSLCVLSNTKLYAQERVKDFGPGSCTVQLEDSLNKFQTVLTAAMEPNGSYEITDRSPKGPPQTIEITIKGADTTIGTLVGVPHMTPKDITARYGEMVARLRAKGSYSDGQLKWTLPTNSTCQGLDLELIMFLVFEWFYFG